MGLTPRRFLPVGCVLMLMSVASPGQQAATSPPSAQSNDKKTSQDKKDPNKPEPKKEPAPLFGGKLGIKSSSSSKETAAMGFNGIDPSGKVDAQMLATSPSAEHEAQAKHLAAMAPSAADLAAFLQEGGLKSK